MNSLGVITFDPKCASEAIAALPPTVLKEDELEKPVLETQEITGET